MVHHDRARPDFGLVGYGRFGRFLAPHLARRGSVAFYDPLPQPADDRPESPGTAPEPRTEARSAPLDFVCSARAVVFCVPIGRLPAVLQAAAPLLRPATLVLDTASVKVWPCHWMRQHLPGGIEIAGTHPLFGPDSASLGLEGQRLVLVPVRLRRRRMLGRFLRSLGLEVIETSAEEHDRSMAETQGIVHWLGRGLERIGAGPRQMDTAGYRRLLEILGHVTRDSWELFLDLERWNPYAAGVRRRLLEVLNELDRACAPAAGDPSAPLPASPPPPPRSPSC